MRAVLTTAASRQGRLLRLAPAAVAATATSIPTSPPFSFRAPGAPGSARYASSPSNSQWKQRQGKDPYTREARVQSFKSRAAFKLLEMDSKHKFFERGQTIIDLGYAPGSWSQVAVERTKPNGRVVGIDLLPAAPPKGVSTIQGNFLNLATRNLVKDYLQEYAQRPPALAPAWNSGQLDQDDVSAFIRGERSYIDSERAEPALPPHDDAWAEVEGDEGKLVDVVLSDMCVDFPEQTGGFGSKSLTRPYRRMHNTSGNPYRDHVSSIDLCLAALEFASDTLVAGGHFVCKYYQGAEAKDLEKRLRKMFEKVHREKPESSRSDSKEQYFVALRRKPNVTFADYESPA